ncbi:MAG: UDP-N-acetylmuramate dehydrogenase [Bacillota bacterium]|nr:UDP-N-acetylmuramate dehydrogenase [Bacillota bacterium]
MDTFFDKLKNITTAEENALMSEYTTFKTGGPARYLACPKNKEEIKEIIKLCKSEGIKPIILGKCSNVLVSDSGIDTLVIILSQGFDFVKSEGELLFADAGVSLTHLAQFAAENSLTGLEFASGIPGSLGGAIFMNAGAYGGEMSHVVIKSFYLDENGEEHEVTDNEFGKRKSFYTGKDYLITGAVLKLKKGSEKEIKEKMAMLAKSRREKQPLSYPSAGSIFKRPEGYFAGALIEGAGLKGCRIGGAEVSDLHAGFIINVGGATSKDVLDLIKHIQKTVFEKDGVMLEKEVRVIGMEE